MYPYKSNLYEMNVSAFNLDPQNTPKTDAAKPASARLPRTCLLILAISAMGGTWVLEQPRSSLVDWHPRVRLLFRLLPKVGGSKKIIWYIMFGCLFSKSPRILIPWKYPQGLWSPLVGLYVWISNSKKAQGMVKFPDCTIVGFGSHDQSQVPTELCEIYSSISQPTG